MLTTGAQTAQGTPASEPRPVADAHAAAASGDALARGLGVLPMDCPVCGDVPAEPQAMAADFRKSPPTESLLAVCCSTCASVYLTPGLPAEERNRLISQTDADHPPPALPPATSGGARLAELRARGDASVAELTSAGGTYDQVILHHNLEYMSDPRAQLEEIRASLSPNGRVTLLLHNVESPCFALFGGRHWAGYDFPRQRAVYPIGAVRRLAESAGYTVHTVHSVPDPGCWVESMHRMLDDWNAPAWLTHRFAASALCARGAFGAVEHLLHWQGKGALLLVTLQAGV